MKAFPLAPALLAAASAFAQQPPEPDRAAEIQELRGELARISAQLDALEKSGGADAGQGEASARKLSAAAAELRPEPPPALTRQDTPALKLLRTTTLNFAVDGYYGYNYNQPAGRVNLLRAYDVTSNSFNISQASLIVEKQPTPEDRAGGRIDLLWGQATETLGGSPLNEQRPQVWRNLFQAYGSFLAPMGSGLELDFGKFASSLGNEGDYTKDQIAYSRAYSYNYLPFYHMGLRAIYALTQKVSLTYLLVNGAQQTEDLNGGKSQGFLWTLKPASTLTWNINYYFGQESRDTPLTLYPGPPALPTQAGLPLANLSPSPDGREHIFDTYASWAATPKLQLLGEADYVLNRTLAEQQPGRVVIGAFYARYTLPRDWYIAGRAEYLDDRGGLFSGQTQALKEVTAVVNRQLAPGFLLRGEYRRDFSNQLFFLSQDPQTRKPAQTTSTLGLVYWWGAKQGAW